MSEYFSIQGKNFFMQSQSGKTITTEIKLLSNLAYEKLGILPIAKTFSKLEYADRLIPYLESLLTCSEEISEIRGAFLLISEYMEQNQLVNEHFILNLTSLYCKSIKSDDWILSYVFNRSPQLRNEVMKILKNNNKFTPELEQKFTIPNECSYILHIISVLINSDENPDIRILDHFFPLEVDSKFNYQLLMLTRDLFIKNTITNSKRIKLWLENGMLHKKIKISTKTYLTQITLISKVKDIYEVSELANLYLKSSLITPDPLGKFLYGLYESFAQQTNVDRLVDYSLNLVARSYENKTINGDFLDNNIWNQIILHFNTTTVTLSKFQDYIKSESIEFIVTELLHHLNLRKVNHPNDPFLICELLGIPVIHLELPLSIEGLTIKSQSADKGYIVLNKKNINSLREKYTLAHEIGHFILHNFPEDNFVLLEQGAINDGSISKNNHSLNINTPYTNLWEKEANYFAQLLLIPSGCLVETKLREIKIPFLNNIAALSKEWSISQSALLTRYINITHYQAILILANNGDITFSTTSAYWEGDKINLWGHSIPNTVMTYDLINSDSYRKVFSKSVSIKNWIPDYSYDISLVEEAFSTGYGTTCTILYIP